MGKSIEPTEDFVEGWLEIRKQEGDLNLSILEIIERHREGADIDEAGLLRSLLVLA